MNLHNNYNHYISLISQVSEKLNLSSHIIEKDYWVTKLLKSMSSSEYASYMVFKGGTSLSKGYGIIRRFSEDVDIALKPKAYTPEGIHKRPGEAIHRFIKKIDVDGLSTIKEGKESEKLRYKRAYEFPSHFDYPYRSPIHDRVILEVNAFSNPVPVERVTIISLMGQFISDEYGADNLLEVGLAPFTIDALAPERTFCEKLLALRRAIYKGNAFFEARVRHLYDIHQLTKLERIQSFINSSELETMLSVCHQDDELNMKITNDGSFQFVDNVLFSESSKIIRSVEDSYFQLRQVTYDKILPSIDEVITTFTMIGDRLQHFLFK